MTKHIDILTQLNNLLIEALANRQNYLEGYQKYLTTFIKNYDTSLNKNSKPLFDFFKKIDNVEKVKINLWLIKNTSLDGCTVSKEGLKIRLKEGFDTFTIFDDSIKWYQMKVEVKPFEPTDEKLKKSLVNLLKHYQKQAIKDILETL